MDTHPITAFATQYLHEDWEDDHPDLADVIAIYIDETGRPEQIALGTALVKLLEETVSEEDTEKKLEELDWLVFFDDMPIRTVLHHIAEIMLSDED